MATETVAFSIKDQNGTIASGNLIIQSNTDGTYTVVGITGTVRGVTIDGLSNYKNADQLLTERPEFTQTYGFNVDGSGIGFTAGGVNYNLMATSNSSGMCGAGSQTGDALAGDDGYQATVSFSSDHTRNACFTTGTMLATRRGPVAVERLVVGDMALTSSGRFRPIGWIGHRNVHCAGPLGESPVRTVAGAFGDGLPERDLYLSPGHPVLVGADADGEGGYLVPIMCLVNGTTIERVRMDSVTYWHVELDAHDILLAEGLPAESYLDWGDRAFFTEADAHALQNPDFVAPGLSARCRPVAVDGPVVETERARLDVVFATNLRPPAPGLTREASSSPEGLGARGYVSATAKSCEVPMSVQVRSRRESAAFLSTYVGAQGELLVDTTNNRVQVHDGATPGGWPAAKLADVLGRTQVTDASYAAQASDRTIAFTALTAARTVSLPAASTYPTGTQLLVVDETGQCSATNAITVARAGSDTINGATSAVLTLAYGYLALQSNGATRWTIIDQSTRGMAQQDPGAVTITGGAVSIPQVVATSGNGGSGSALLVKSSGNAAFGMWSTTAPTDSGKWDFLGAPTGFYFRALNDAESAAATWLQVARSGAGVTGITLGAPTRLPSYAVAVLPAAGTTGRIVFCSNARMQTTTAGTLEAAGAGTGGLVVDNGSAWKLAGTNITASA